MQSGSGLGVYHAKKTIEAFGGKYEIESELGAGTKIKMSLISESPPDWFVQQINITKGQSIIATDDDSSILEVWKQRFSNLIDSENLNLVTCSTGTCLRNWVLKNSDSARTAIYLMDYELLSQKQTGLDLIEELGLNSKAILISSRYDEPLIKEKCQKLQVKMIPKSLASLVPINIIRSKSKIDCVLIDDDVELIHATWKIGAKNKGKSVCCFADEGSFIKSASEISFETPIYVDMKLSNGVSGLDVAKKIHELGFENINLATGYEAAAIEKPNYIREISGKDFPL